MAAARLAAGVILAALSLQVGAACTQISSSKLVAVGDQQQRPSEPQGELVSQAAQPSTLPSRGTAASSFRVEPPPIASSKPLEEVGPDGGQSQPGPSAQLKTVGSQNAPDPLAPLNHKVLRFNANVDDKAFHPVANGWAKIMPKPVRQCIHRFFDNMAFVRRFANAAFQMKLKDAGGELARFGINSTVGVAGLFDPADKWLGIEEHENNFGKTLAAWGMSGGLFVVMPVAGPVNVRNALGHFVDGALNPMNYLVPGSAEIYTTLAHSIEGLNERAETLDRFEGVSLGSDQFHPAALDSPELYEAVRANFLRKESQKEQGSATDTGAARAGGATAGEAVGGPGQASAATSEAAASGSR